MLSRVNGYVRANWGASFIAGFMLLLLVAAVSLSIGLVALADGVAVVAYYALVVGVVLQSIYYLKYDKRNGEKNMSQTESLSSVPSPTEKVNRS